MAKHVCHLIIRFHRKTGLLIEVWIAQGAHNKTCKERCLLIPEVVAEKSKACSDSIYFAAEDPPVYYIQMRMVP